ncbi:MAG: folylpolyglutamate synthase/dihydrofolate synthase family protein [Ignavibacteriaceae bacterium]
MDTASSFKKLFDLHNFGVKLGLDNTIKFLEYLGNPQKLLKTIHIAGSNGKGSTACFISGILQDSGYRTGLYTSPHFVKFNERVVINGIQVNDEFISDFLTEHEAYIDEHQLTFFEVTTALAFKYFSEEDIDVCVIETGLGGRLDATNVLSPLAVVITSISYEHTNILGERLEQIAAEKAAIIKPGVKVFTGKLPLEAERVVQEKCDKEDCKLFKITDFVDEKENKLSLMNNVINLDEIKIPVKGSYQKYNASLAALVVSNSFPHINQEQIIKGIENTVINTGLQGRYEYFHKNPTIIFDAAHNPEGVENFISEFKNEYDSYRKRVLLFGAMQDKAIGTMLKELSTCFDEIHITEIDYERSAKVDAINTECQRLGIDVVIEREPVEFVTSFLNKQPGECLVVLGSIHLLGNIKAGMTINIT